MELKIEKPIVFFDLESSGLNTESDRIVQIAAIKYLPDGEVIQKECLINPNMSIPLEASEVHGITDEMVADAPTFKQLSKGLREFFQGCDLGGFNSNNFDVPLLNAELLRAGLEGINWNPNLLDVFLLYRHFYSNKLTEIYKRFFGKDLEEAHSALADTSATVEVLDKLLKDSQMSCTVEEIDLTLQADKKRVDLAGKMYRNEEDVVCWSFGKNQDKHISSDRSYVNWFLSADFPQESKEKLKENL